MSLLAAWSEAPESAVMVGNHGIDLQAGRAAGTVTVHVDREARFAWSEQTDIAVKSLLELRAVVAATD